jgi:hypothetical protein
VVGYPYYPYWAWKLIPIGQSLTQLLAQNKLAVADAGARFSDREARRASIQPEVSNTPRADPALAPVLEALQHWCTVF